MVAIKDMDMPKSCSECPLHFFDPIEGLCCQMIIKHIDCKPKHDRDSRCPLVEIITCKNCDNWDKRHYRGNTCYCEMRMIHTEPNEFCNEAMRKAEYEAD